MKEFIPVKGNTSLARDPRTGAIVNINSSEIELARQRKQARRRQQQENQQLMERVSRLESLVQQLIEKEHGSTNR